MTAKHGTLGANSPSWRELPKDLAGTSPHKTCGSSSGAQEPTEGRYWAGCSSKTVEAPLLHTGMKQKSLKSVCVFSGKELPFILSYDARTCSIQEKKAPGSYLLCFSPSQQASSPAQSLSPPPGSLEISSERPFPKKLQQLQETSQYNKLTSKRGFFRQLLSSFGQEAVLGRLQETISRQHWGKPAEEHRQIGSVLSLLRRQDSSLGSQVKKRVRLLKRVWFEWWGQLNLVSTAF